jgi:hypothetical protein
VARSSLSTLIEMIRRLLSLKIRTTRKNEMENVSKLRLEANLLQSLLVKYSVTDSDAAMVLEFMRPLFEVIDNGRVVPPKEFEFRWYFGSTDSPLAKFGDLIDAAANFAHTLEGWPTPIILGD